MQIEGSVNFLSTADRGMFFSIPLPNPMFLRVSVQPLRRGSTVMHNEITKRLQSSPEDSNPAPGEEHGAGQPSFLHEPTGSTAGAPADPRLPATSPGLIVRAWGRRWRPRQGFAPCAWLATLMPSRYAACRRDQARTRGRTGSSWCYLGWTLRRGALRSRLRNHGKKGHK